MRGNRHPELRPQPESRDLSLEEASFSPGARLTCNERSFDPQDDAGHQNDEVAVSQRSVWTVVFGASGHGMPCPYRARIHRTTVNGR
jgi:hypothetical protein